MKKENILLAFFFLLILTGPLWGANLLNNPGFESQGYWGLQVLEDTAATASWQSTTAARTGSYGGEVTISRVDGTNWHVQVNTPSNWTAEDGTKYNFSFWAKADIAATIHVAIQDGPDNNYEYRTGYDFAIGTTWKEISVSYTSDVNGSGALRFTLFVGNAATTIYFDDFLLEEENFVNPGDIALPEQGAYDTGIYRNLFKEMGKTDAEINTKLNSSFNQLFHGNSDSETVYYEVGDDMAFIKDINSDDIRSEGLSYGMMIAVQMDKKTEFDKIWKFTKTYAQHQSGPRKGYIAWNVNAYNYAIEDPNSAPDGEEYFVMSLLFASHRWGDGTGIFDYNAEAQQLLYDMLHLEERNGGVVDGLVNMFNKNEKMVVFVPEGSVAEFSDPSYHLPGFYKLWALWADQDNALWNEIADTSVNYLQAAMHPVTGLTTDYMTFNAQPKQTDFNNNSHRYASDSWRIAMNIGMDCQWFGNDNWQPAQINKLLGFFYSQGMGTYDSVYEQDGTPLPDNYHAGGLVACNAAGSLAATDGIAWDFVSEFWSAPVPSGQYRYYDGLLYMMSLLHASGNYRIWKPGTGPGLKGDVNGDGVVNIVDALQIAQYSVDIIPEGFDASVADVNDDSVINIIDALKVAQLYVGIIPSL